MENKENTLKEESSVREEKSNKKPRAKRVVKKDINPDKVSNDKKDASSEDRKPVKNMDKKPIKKRSYKKGFKKPKTTQKVEAVANNRMDLKKYKSDLCVIPLGGLHEIGKNSAVIQYKDEMIVVDMGLAFPDETMPGVDLVIPNYNYLYKNIDKLKAVIITHGHEDHIGSISHFYRAAPKKSVPLYSSEFTVNLIKGKLAEKIKGKKFNLNAVKERDIVKVGKYISVEFIRITHSIPDAFVVAVHTPEGTIVHTGDYKFDLTPVDGKHVDFYKLAELGEKGTLLMLSDSTNANKEGFTPSELQVVKSFKDVMHRAQGRVIVAAFASHAHRVQELIKVAHDFGRKTALDGRSMHKCFDIGTSIDSVQIPEGSVLPLSDMSGLEKNKVLVVCTGTQGEDMSALSRAARGEHRELQIEPGDSVVISANKIPGNEVSINRVVNELIKKGAHVYAHGTNGLHVSGHGCRGDIALMLNLIKPKFFMPVHGEYMHLHGSKQLAQDVGMHADDVIITSNGDKVEVAQNFIRVTGTVEAGEVLIDAKNPRGIPGKTIYDRNIMSTEGLLVVHILINVRSRKINGQPEIIGKGLGHSFNNKEIAKEIILANTDKQINDVYEFKKDVKSLCKKLARKMYSKNPMIIVLVATV